MPFDRRRLFHAARDNFEGRESPGTATRSHGVRFRATTHRQIRAHSAA